MHLSLPVTKLEEAGRFYEGLLGTPPTRSFPGYTHFVTPTVNLALTAAQEVRVSDSEHFGVEVPNVGRRGGARAAVSGRLCCPDRGKHALLPFAPN